MKNGEPEFDPLSAMRPRAGGCPDADALAAFAAESLPAAEAARVRDHVSLCGICDSLVERLRDFDQPAAGDPPGWAATEGRLRARVFPKPRWRMVLLHPAFAYGVALVAVVLALAVGGRPAPPATMIAMESLRTIDLNTTRGGEAPRFAFEPGERFVLLSFLIGVRPGFRYEASLDGRSAQAVVSTDGKGNFALRVSRDLLGPGAHRLTVNEINPASGKVEQPFEFWFQL